MSKVLMSSFNGYMFYSDYTYQYHNWDKRNYSKWKLNKETKTVTIKHLDYTNNITNTHTVYGTKLANGYDDDIEFYNFCCEVDDLIRFNKAVEGFLSK